MNHSKELFLTTASKLFAVKGYHATGISEILKISGAPKGSLYYYFPGGKEELAAEALSQTIDNIEEKLIENFHTHSDFLSAVAGHLNFLADKVDSQEFDSQISIALMALENFTTCETLRELCQKFYDDIIKIYKQKLEENGIKPRAAKEIASMMVTMVEGGITLALTAKDSTPLRILAKNIKKYIKLPNLA